MSEPTALDEPLLRLGDLAVWARTEVEADDAWAKTCIRAASALVRETAGQPTWTATTVPVIAKIVVAQCAMRAYVNPPEGEISSSIGPLGSRLLDAVAEGIHLTDDETARLASFRPPEERARGSRTWTISMSEQDTAPTGERIHLADGIATLGRGHRVASRRLRR